jgi:hypothetical protein
MDAKQIPKRSVLKRVLKHKLFLRKLSRVLKKKRPSNSAYLDKLGNKCSKSELTCLCEIIHNLVKGNIPISTTVKDELTKYAVHLHQLEKPKQKAKQIRSILKQCGAGVWPILISTVLPLVIELVRKM